MDKRFVTFLMLAMLIIVGYIQLRLFLNPPVEPDPAEVAQNDNLNGEEPLGQEDTDGKQQVDPDDVPGDDPDATPPDAEVEETPSDDANSAAAQRKNRKQQWTTLGSVDENSDYRMLLTFNNRGATLERAELSSPKYRDLEDETGYFGHLALTNSEAGAVVNAVGRGTPAASAGLKIGDVILAVNDEELDSAGDEDFATQANNLLHQGSPGEDVTIEVERGEGEAAKTLTLSTTLVHPHLQVIQPEHISYINTDTPLQPFSYLTTLSTIGNVSTMQGGFSRDEIDRIPSLYESNWEVIYDEQKPDEVAFKFTLDAGDLKEIPDGQPLEIIKRFRLAKIDAEDDAESPAYHLTMTIEVHNLGEKTTTVAVEQRGPTGLPLEGWWYVRKGSTEWGSAGMRDIVWHSEEGKNVQHRVAEIYSDTEDQEHTELFAPDAMNINPVMRYVGGDSCYFSSVMLPDESASSFDPEKFRYAFGEAIATGELIKKWKATTGTSFRLVTQDQRIAPGKSFEQQYTVFIGPKDPLILQPYGLEDTIVFGWPLFAHIARFLLVVLHYIHLVVRNYGISIILLTVLVRMAVLPIGRRQAQNAAKMQELAPEMKAIADKHKDMETRAKAQQELFKRHNYHPLGGCWMMFIQLPIFFGLYKALSTSINLRQAPLIPGLDWCSNLAGPDMFLYWEPFMPSFLAAKNGFLGPYLNILPLVTIALFIVQQKLFTPPATDDQQKMQQGMMKYMMVFMGFMFFKVPSGLCLYFIVSACWSIAERKLLPKPKPKGMPIEKPDDDAPAKKKKPAAKPKTKADMKENSLMQMLNRLREKPEETNGQDGPDKRRPKRKKKKRK